MSNARDMLTADVVALGNSDAIRAILDEMCRVTQMGFAAVARVTDERWIACQIVDRIDFGLDPGDELDLKTTICDEIRQRGECVVIDHVDTDIIWQTHHIPRMYGFKSYASFPIVLDDGSFFGTLCAIDPEPRSISGAQTIAAMRDCAARVARLLS